MFFNKTVRNINRISEVINILVKYSFEDIVANTALRNFVSAKKQVTGMAGEKRFFEYTRWERIKMVIEELGTTAIKLAQFLSNRPDILPEELITEFKKLQSNVSPYSSKKAIEIIEREINRPIDSIFSYFDHYTIGSASIGQVHRAKLRTGEDVVVKVQRPGAEKRVKTDLILLREFVKLTENYFKDYGILNPLEIVDTFEESMLKELDYHTETRNTLQFKSLYHNVKFLKVPKPYREYSSSKVLVLEFISGCTITDLKQLSDWGLDRKTIARRGLHIYLTQIFKFGLFHADPHPGNIMVFPNGIISLIDYGMIGKLTKKQRYYFTGILFSLVQMDSKRMAEYFRKLSNNREILNMSDFENDLQELIDDFVVFDVEHLGMRMMVIRLQRIIYKHKLQVSGSIFLLLRALAILEGVGRVLDPDIEVLDLIKPYVKKIIKEQYSATKIKSDIRFAGSQLATLLYEAPLELSYILKKIRTGEIHANFTIQGYEFLLRRIDTSVNKIVFSIIIAALLLASSVIFIAQPDEMLTILGFPVASIIGFGIAFIIAIWLLLYTIRNRFKKKINK